MTVPCDVVSTLWTKSRNKSLIRKDFELSCIFGSKLFQIHKTHFSSHQKSLKPPNQNQIYFSCSISKTSVSVKSNRTFNLWKSFYKRKSFSSLRVVELCVGLFLRGKKKKVVQTILSSFFVPYHLSFGISFYCIRKHLPVKRSNHKLWYMYNI